jgi:cellulose biosynthesis protein BcsQ
MCLPTSTFTIFFKRDFKKCATVFVVIIAFISMKGGVGKSTLAAHAYSYAKRQGLNVWLVDMDAQGSSSAWLDGNEENAQCYHIPKPADAVEAIKTRNADSDVVIVDGGGGLELATKAGLMVADLAVIPTRASRIDYNATMEVLRLANQVRVERGRDAARVLVVPSMIMAGQLTTNQLLDELEELEVPIGQPIHQRSVFAKAAGDMNFVWDHKDSNAIAEVEMLMQSILEK